MNQSKQDILVVMHVKKNPPSAQFETIGYVDPDKLEDAKEMAERHYGGRLIWNSGYSLQGRPIWPSSHWYVIHQEQVNIMTSDAEKYTHRRELAGLNLDEWEAQDAEV